MPEMGLGEAMLLVVIVLVFLGPERLPLNRDVSLGGLGLGEGPDERSPPELIDVAMWLVVAVGTLAVILLVVGRISGSF